MKNKLTISNIKKYAGDYRGVFFEIYENPSALFNSPIFTYYIYVKPRELKYIELLDKKNNAVCLQIIDYSQMYFDVNFHGGITYMAEITQSNLIKYHKIGCDYEHFYDENITYTLDDIKKDIKETIDTLPKDLFLNL